MPDAVNTTDDASPDFSALCRLLVGSQHGVLNVAPLTFDRLAGLLPRLLPAAWCAASIAVGWAPAKDPKHPSETWICLFWAKAKVCVH